MKKTITTLSSAIVFSLTMGTAIAETNMTNRLLERFDVNQDGSISGDEVQFVLDEKFTTADKNKDGFLTQEEMSTAHEQHHQERAAEHFAEFDTDKSGSLSVEEFQAGKSPGGKHCGKSKRRSSRDEISESREQRHQKRATRRFAWLDTDGNNSLSIEEFQAGKPPAGKRPKRKFSRFDLDGDGMLSRTEANAPKIKKFERLDTNQDGVITAEELSQAPSRHRGGRHHRK